MPQAHYSLEDGDLGLVLLLVLVLVLLRLLLLLYVSPTLAQSCGSVLAGRAPKT